MPQIANLLLRHRFDKAPSDLYSHLQKGGDSDKFFSNGSGGLGQHLLSRQAKEAFYINSSAGKNGKTVQIKARDIDKLWELAELFKLGGTGETSSFRKNSNKHIICLVFIVLQETTMLTWRKQELAYNELLDNYYGANVNYMDHILAPENKNGETVRQKLQEMHTEFLKLKKNLSPLQKTTTLNTPLNTPINSPHNTEYSLLSRAPHYNRNSYSDIHVPINMSNLTPMQMGLYSANSPSPHSPNASAHSASAYTPSAHSPSAHSPTAHSPHSAGSTGRAASAPAEFKYETAVPQPDVAVVTVQNFLRDMIERHKADDYSFTTKDLKVAQMVYFIANVDNLTLIQLNELCKLMDNVQQHVLQNDNRFDAVRAESFFLRRWFAPFGNTATWQKMGTRVQDVMLRELQREELRKLYPEYSIQEIKSQDLSRSQKLPLPADAYQDYYRLFATSFSRNPNATPPVLEKYRNRFVDQPTGSLRRR